MIENRLFELANLFIRVMTFDEAGDIESYGGHVHEYDHAHFLAVGEMDVEVNGVVSTYAAPAMIWIAAKTAHKMTARVPGTVGLCIHAIRAADGSGDPVDPKLVPAGSSAWALTSGPDRD